MNKFLNKKLIAFDVDGTLSQSRSKISQKMSDYFQRLLQEKKIAIITGGAFADIEKQILSEIGLNNEINKNLTLLPTNGGALFIFNHKWEEVSSHKLTPVEKEKITRAIEKIIDCNKDLQEQNSFGKKIQDRDSEITFSALGENAPLELKKAWDVDGSKKSILQKKLSAELPEFEVKIGGTTSIDITPKGMDKSYAINQLLKYYKLNKEDILFIGDSVYEGGNDYPALLMGVDTIKVSDSEETIEIIKSLLV